MRPLQIVVTVVCAAASYLVSAQPVDIDVIAPPIPLRAVPGETVDGFPKFFVTEGRIAKTMVANGKLIGFENADGTQTRFSHVLLPYSGGRISHLVFSDTNGNANAVVKVFGSGGITAESESHARYTLEDPRSIEQIQSEIDSQQTRKETFYSSALGSAKVGVAPNLLPAERRKDARVCELVCNRDSEFAINRCDTGFDSGLNVCNLLDQGGPLGYAGGMECRRGVVKEREKCKDRASIRKFECSLNCADPFQYNPR